MGWLAVILGLTVLLACFLLPREIGREDQPLVEVKLPRDLAPVLPAAAALVPFGGVPWYVHVAVGVSGPLAYLIFRIAGPLADLIEGYLLYRLAVKVIEKADGHFAAIVIAIVATRSRRAT